jgi:hypothetical protein
VVCGNAALTINGQVFPGIQTGNPIYDFVFARDPAWGTTCP